MKAEERISMPAIIKMRREIQDAGGNEVFFVGQINENCIVTSIKACSRGDEHSVGVNFFETHEPCVFIHNHPGGDLTPSGADMAVASRANENLCGFFIVDNDVKKVYVVMEPIPPRKIQKLDQDQAASYIQDGGPLSALYDNFEERPVQVDLLRQIAGAFNDNSIAAFEAGTGVGKSFAYLIPAMLWASKNKERVVVSTGTINLQQQLSEKDIPAAKKILGLDIKAVLLKGRNNYVCLRRLEEMKKERDLFTSETEALEQIAEWAKTSAEGSKSELTFNPSENLWGRVCSESDACMGLHCPYRDKCFVMAARRDASDAQILVVNHHLLFADIESRMNAVGYDDAAVLPPYKRIVFDEAHGIESAATRFFSEQVTRFRIIKQINLLYRERRSSLAGYIFTLTALSTGPDNTEKVGEAVDRIKDSIKALETAALDLLQNDWTCRLYEKTAASFAPILSLLTSMGGELSRLVALVREICDNVPDEDKSENAYWETKAITRRLEDAASVCKDFSFWEEKRDQVFWIQKQRLNEEFVKDGLPYYFIFSRTPLDIAPLMNTGVFEPMESVVCASATLKIAGSFDFWTRRTGLSFVEAERLKSAGFDSPFPYEKNVLFACPKDIPFPDSIEFQQYVELALIKLIKASKGRALVLFTSYDSLKSAYNTCQYELSKNGINVFKQGDDDRFRLLDKFKNDETSALFATDSFWQGIDVPGSSLSQVIIVKLPFSVPNDPVFAARAEEVERRGGSSFMELSLPEAVIKFRQGFGRLVRRSTDRGAVVVLDRRIIEKRYGKTFLDSLPKTKSLYAPLSDICEAVERLLD
ncbi:MAG: DEAD/DEAH box helicase family protein [Treponema sp.]|nr:DEAD/DEAH box helicase family protein [Treponema sp.]